MGKIFAVSAALALLSGTAQAAPAVFAFDDFSATQPTGGNNVVNGYLTDTTRRAAACDDPQFGGQGSITRTGANATAVTGPVGSFTRSISINVCSGLRPFQAQTGVNVGGSGFYEVINDVGEISVAGLRYDLGEENQFQDEIDAFTEANGGEFDEFGLAFQVVESDGNPVDVYAYLNGDLLDVQSIGNNFTGQFVFFLDPSTELVGTLDIVFLGGAGYDIGIDGVGLYINNTNFVPAPAALALFGLGLVGVALGRRR